MDQRLPNLYKEYGQYSNWRNIPSEIDGLKPVERRVLLSAYKIARTGFVKSRQVDSYTTGHYHPHGEVYGTVVQLVKQGFLIGQGNFGTNVGVEPVGAAASRYTECKLNPKMMELVFKYIKYVPFVDTELQDTEPLYLPTMYPLCLLGSEYSQGIGFGYRTFLPCYTIRDLHQRLLWLLGIRKRKPIIAPITDCTITSSSEDVESLLTTGKAKIDVTGVLDIHTRQNKVILKSWPSGKRFETILNKFSDELSQNIIGFNDFSASETNIEFQILRDRNRDKLFSEFLSKLTDAVAGSISFENVLIDKDNNVIVKSVDQMLIDTYNMFTKINEDMLKDVIRKIDESIDEYKLLEEIKPLVAKYINLDIDVATKNIAKDSKITENVISGILDKYKIKKLLTVVTDTTNLQKDKASLQSNLKNINSYVLDQYSSQSL